MSAKIGDKIREEVRTRELGGKTAILASMIAAACSLTFSLHQRFWLNFLGASPGRVSFIYHAALFPLLSFKEENNGKKSTPD